MPWKKPKQPRTEVEPTRLMISPGEEVQIVTKTAAGFRQNLYRFTATFEGEIRVLDSFSTFSNNKKMKLTHHKEQLLVYVPSAWRHCVNAVAGDYMHWMRLGNNHLLFEFLERVEPRPPHSGVPLCDGCGGFIYRNAPAKQRKVIFNEESKYCRPECYDRHSDGLKDIRV